MKKLSVCITTFNVEKYIAQTIESVLSQKTSFDYEIIVGEDRSTDNTVSILRKFEAEYPNKIRLIHNKENLGMMKNFIKTIEFANSKYIAILDGDDYWTDDSKLQKQFEFLESNPEYTLCWHDSLIVDSNGNVKSSFTERFVGRNNNLDLDLYQVIRWKVLGGTSSIFFRNVLSPFPSWAYNLYGTDAILFMRCRELGKLFYMSGIMSAYRIHQTSMERRFTKITKALRNINEETILSQALYPKFRSHFFGKISWNTFYVALMYLKQFRLLKSIKSFYSLVFVFPKWIIFKMLNK
jgi:glycosyltransferase involved in cell wall biosynthesis